MNKYKVGDTPFYAHFERTQLTVTCPVCNGDKHVVLILGDKTEVQLDCDYCGKGYEAPTGTISDWGWVEKVTTPIIKEVHMSSNSEGEQVEYIVSPNYIAKEEDLFDSEDEAQIRAKEKRIEWAESEAKQFDAQVQRGRKHKNYSWTAGYHLSNAKDKRREAERHEARAIVCKSKARPIKAKPE